MKKCPKCKAEIEENARFCLYCMTSFEEKQPVLAPNQEKNKRWLYILAAVLVFVLILCFTFIFVLTGRKANPSNTVGSDLPSSTYSSLISDITSASDNTALNSETEGDNITVVTSNHNSSQAQTISNSYTTTDKVSSQIKTDSTSTKAPSASGSSASGKPDSSSDKVSSNKSSSDTSTKAPSASGSSSSGKPDSSCDKVSSNKSSSDTSTKAPSASGSSSSGKPDSSSSDTTSVSSAPPAETAEYLYRDAKYGDDYAVFTNLTNCVVITGIKTASADGRYTIPETIDGKNVLAIMQGAFCADGISDTVKEVIVPSTVKTIWNSAFTKCYNLTDIYFCGTSIYTDPYAFADISRRNGAITIHCSATCSDREFRTYKSYITNYLNDTLKDYSILYDEWNYED